MTTAATIDEVRIRRRGYVLGMLVLVYMFNFIDRNILVILQEQIRAEFQLKDWQLGLMTGAAFNLFYTTMALPIARLADRGVMRTTIIAAAIAAWSLMTAAGSLAQNYAHLLLARIGVGIGEAGSGPSSLSMIADLYPRRERGRAMAFYAIGVPLGSMAGLVFGGWVAQTLGWRTALLVIGLPGLLVALAFRATVPEPPRGLSEGATPPADVMPLSEVLRTMLHNRTFRQVLAAGSLGALCNLNTTLWFAPFFMRTHGMTIAQVGLWWGLVTGFAGMAGALAGGWLSDRLGARDPRRIVLVPMAGMLLIIPFFYAAVTVESAMLALAFMVVPTMLNSLWIAPNMALGQSLTPLPMRAMAGASMSLVQNIVAGMLGPLLMGALSDLLTAQLGSPAEGLRWTLIAMGALYLWAATHFWLASRTIARDLVS